ncbi:MAG: hypothetical protein LBK68_06500 [Candidatus Margulisbacteria bacterium]|nr:hypothetical protein [Candidatus Margulisiibacteriota bacterium]
MVIKTGEPLLASDINDLTFFPKGAILTFSNVAWSATSAKFKTIWKICDTANHQADPNNVPDLTKRFLRGGSSSDFTTGGGADSRDVILQTTNLPSHNHGVTSLPVEGLTSGLSIASDGGKHSHSGGGTTTAGEGGHTHGFSGNTTAGEGAHGHLATDVYDPGHTHNLNVDYDSAGAEYYPGAGGGHRDTSSVAVVSSTTGISISGGGGHTHSLSGNTTAGEGIHSHNFGVSIDDSGSHTHTLNGSITGGSVSGSVDNTGDNQAFSVDTVPSYYTVIYIIKVV